MTDDENKGFASRVARSFAFSGVGNIVGRLIAVASIGIGVTLLTPAEFGAASLAMAVLAIVRAFTEAGLGVALVHTRDATREQIDSLFWTSLVITAGTYLLLYVAAAPVLGLIYHETPHFTSLVRGMCFSVALYTFYFIPRAFMERELHFGRIVVIDTLSYTVAAGLLYYAASHGKGAFAFVWFEIGMRGCQAVLSILARPFMPGLRLRFGEIRKMFNFAMYATGSRLLFNIYSNSDFFIVGKFFGDAVVGVYTAAWRVVSEPVRGLTMAVNHVAYPAFASLQDDLPRLRRYFFTINEASLALIGSVLGLVVVYSGPVIRSIDAIPQEYVKAIPLIWLFGIMGILKAIAPLIPQLLNAVGQSRLSFFYSLTCAVVLPLAFLVGAQFAMRGVVLAWVLGYPLVVLVLFYFAATVLELPARSMIRAFRGLRVSGPVFGIELLLYVGLSRGAGLSEGLSAAIGAPASLLIGALLARVMLRESFAELRRGE